MIWFIVGKPGDGKSYCATRKILDHLLTDSRPLVTNIHLSRRHLAAWLVSRGLHPHVAFHRVMTRVFQIEDGDLQEFYRHRGPVYLDSNDDITIRGQKETQPNYAASVTGIVYFLDEVHIAFPARGWQSNGERHLFYNSQHRKLRDDVFFITQDAEQVDKTFRLLTQGYYVCKNFYRLKFGMFKHGGRFNVRLFYSNPKGQGSVPVESVDYQLEQSVGDCYQTMAGVGIQTNNKPELQKAKGVPLKVLYVAIPVAFFGVVFGMDGLRGGMTKWFASSLTGQSAKVTKATVYAASPARSAQPSAVASQPGNVQVQVRPQYVDFVLREVVYTDGTRYPLTQRDAAVVGPRIALVEGYRVPVIGHPDGQQNVFVPASRLVLRD